LADKSTPISKECGKPDTILSRGYCFFATLFPEMEINQAGSALSPAPFLGIPCWARILDSLFCFFQDLVQVEGKTQSHENDGYLKKDFPGNLLLFPRRNSHHPFGFGLGHIFGGTATPRKEGHLLELFLPGA
jgi:hypothetical protein